MSDIFAKLGKRVGVRLRRGNWLLQALTGTEDHRIDAEFRFGRDLAAETRSLLKIPTTPLDPERARELQQLGASLAARVANRRRHFDFTISESGEPNAFALPGGYIFVEQSLLRFCRWDRDEVGFILGHEMSHIIRGHALERVAGKVAFDLLTPALPGQGLLGVALRRIAQQFLQQAYSREQELEADQLGVRLSTAAGFDPRGAIRLLQRLRHGDRKLSDSGPRSYFGTHPTLDERIENISMRTNP